MLNVGIQDLKKIENIHRFLFHRLLNTLVKFLILHFYQTCLHYAQTSYDLQDIFSKLYTTILFYRVFQMSLVYLI